ncbi:MAG: AAA family ATPase [Alphaproteobacteria bacterium]
MEALERALARAGGGQGQVVSVVGEPGVGKSRLYHEFTRGHHVKDWLVLESGSVSHGRAAAYMPIVDLLRGYFGISTGDDARAIRERITGKLLTLDESLRAIETPLLSLFEVPISDPIWESSEPARRRQRVLDACRALLLREAEEQPLVIVFEDLHWIDSETQAFLDLLIGGIAGARVLLLTNYRPEYADPWSSRTYYTRIRIDPLQPQSAGELLDDLLGSDSTLDPLRALLVERTQGNPFFLEESVKALIDEGALQGGRGDYRLAVPVTSIDVPASVQTVLAARIDRLDPEEKILLQTAAVIGKDFSLPLLGAVLAREADEVPARLARLQEAELVYETRIFPDPEYTFKHALTHDVAYGSLLSTRPKGLHTVILESMEELYAGRESEHLDRLAYHAIKGEQWYKAKRYAHAAGAKAAALNATRSALESFENAISAIGQLPETPELMAENIDLRFQVRDALFVLAEPEPIKEHLREAEALAARLDDRHRLAETLVYQAGFEWMEGKYRPAIAIAERARKLGAESDDTVIIGMAEYRLASAYAMLGEYGAAAEQAAAGMSHLAEQATSLFRFGGLTYTFVGAFRALACSELGDFETAEAVGQEAYRIAKDADHAYSITVSCFGLAHAYLLRERFREALPVLNDGMELVSVHGLTATLPWVAGRFAWALAMTGDTKKAREVVETAHYSFDQLPAAMDHGLNYISAGCAYLALGDLDGADEIARLALAKAERDEEAGVRAWVTWIRGETALKREQSEIAVQHYATALNQAGPLGMATLQAYANLGHGDALAMSGDVAGARASHELARDLAAKHDLMPILTRATERLAD